jgi:hypothetical protein
MYIERKRYFTSLPFVLLLMLTAALATFPQSQSVSKSSEGGKEGSDIICGLRRYLPIVVNVWVTDETGKDVTTLKHDDFVIYEDGVKQGIEFFIRKEDLDPANKRAVYQMGYTPINQALNGKLRKIQVGLKTKDDRQDHKLKVQISPKGYFATMDLLDRGSILRR